MVLLMALTAWVFVSVQLEVQTANRCHVQDQSGLPYMVPVMQQSLAPLATSPHLEETHGNKRLKACLPPRRHNESIGD